MIKLPERFTIDPVNAEFVIDEGFVTTETSMNLIKIMKIISKAGNNSEYAWIDVLIGDRTKRFQNQIEIVRIWEGIVRPLYENYGEEDEKKWSLLEQKKDGDMLKYFKENKLRIYYLLQNVSGFVWGHEQVVTYGLVDSIRDGSFDRRIEETKDKFVEYNKIIFNLFLIDLGISNKDALEQFLADTKTSVEKFKTKKTN